MAERVRCPNCNSTLVVRQNRYKTVKWLMTKRKYWEYTCSECDEDFEVEEK